MITVLHLINSLEVGGAEMFLLRLTSRMDPSRCRSVVAVLDGAGALADGFRDAGIRVVPLGMTRSRPDPRGLVRLVRMLRDLRPDILQTWLYHSDLMGLVAARLGGVRRVAWNLRCSDMELWRDSPRTAVIRGILARLSPLPDAVLSNSLAGRRMHERLGYRPRRWRIIANGVDTEQFRPDLAAHGRLRAALGAPDDAVLVGLAARYHPMKDHATFLRAAAAVAADRPAVRFVLAGRGVDGHNVGLGRSIAGNGLDGRVHLLGERTDMAQLLPGLDVACLSSAFGEGFSNAVAEAMACGVPCAATDVGDAARIVGDCGVVVPPAAPHALAEGLRRLLDCGDDARRELGARCRERIVRHFDLATSVADYERFYVDLAASGGRVH